MQYAIADTKLCFMPLLKNNNVLCDCRFEPWFPKERLLSHKYIPSLGLQRMDTNSFIYSTAYYYSPQ